MTPLAPPGQPDQPPVLPSAAQTGRAALLILGLLALAYGAYAPYARFFWDEWNILPLGLEGGAGHMAQVLYPHRAWVHHLHALGYWLLGADPLAWQLASLALRGLAALMAWWLVRQLCPQRQETALGLAVLVAVFPGYAHYPMGLFAFITYLPLCLATLSLTLTVFSYTAQPRALKAACLLAALVLNIPVTIGYEAFWGLELARPLLILLVLSRRPRPPSWAARAGRALLGWLPYLALWLPYLLWRVLVFKSAKTFINPSDHFGLAGLFSLKTLGASLERLYVALVSFLSLSWTQELLDLAGRNPHQALLIGLGLGLVGAGLVLALSRGLMPPPASPGPEAAGRTLFGLGLIGALLLAPLGGLLNDSTTPAKALLLALALAGFLGLSLALARRRGGGGPWLFCQAWAGWGAGLGVVLPFRYWGQRPAFFAMVLAAGLALALASILIYRRGLARLAEAAPPAAVREESGQHGRLGLAGLLIILLAFAVPVLAGSPGTLGGESRFYPTALAGLGLVWASLLFGLLPRRLALSLLALLAGLGITANHLNGAYFKAAGRQMDDLAWQLYWRAPDLKPGTVAVLKTARLERLTVDPHLSGFLRGIYGHHDLGGVMIRDKKGDARLSAVLAGGEVSTDFQGRRLPLSQPVVVWGPAPGRCLWLISADSPLEARDDQQLWALKQTGQSARIERQPQAPPPAKLFGPEPGHDCWCYYFQKAELARQFGDWPALLGLWEQVRRLGLKPGEPREWLPFALALEQAGRAEEALALRQAMAGGPAPGPAPAGG